MSLRKIIINLHLVIALTAGVLFAMNGVTGSLMVFGRELDEALNRDLTIARAADKEQQPVPYETLLQTAKGYLKAKELDKTHYISSISAPRHEAAAVVVWYKSLNKKDDTLHEIYMSPYSDEIRGERVFGSYFFSFIFKLHQSLLSGDTGKAILGYSTMSLVVLLLSGIYLWWPHRNQRKYMFKPLLTKNVKRQLFDIHRLAGIYTVVILLMSCVSGIYMEFGKSSRALMNTISPIAEAPEAVAVTPGDAVLMSADEAIALAATAFPGSQFSRINFTADAKKSWQLSFTPPDDPKEYNGYNRISIDPYTHKIIASRDWNNASTGDVVLEWMYPLHKGEALGFAGRMVMFWAGWIPLILLVTGFLHWRRRKRHVTL